MRQVKSLIVAAALVALVAGCQKAQTTTAPAPAPAPAKTAAPAQAKSGQHITLAVGETYTVRLKSNPTTGFQWQVAAPADAKVLKLVSQTYTPDNIAPEVVGSGGTETFVYQGVAAGTTSVSLKYARPWEPVAKPAETYSLSVTVK